MHETDDQTPVQNDECELLEDGRVAHYMRKGLDGIFRCVRCPAIAGKHGLIQVPQAASA